MNKIILEIKDRIGYITLNDPPSNKMTGVFFKELNKIIFNHIPSANIDVIIISGKGRHFSSGADINDLLNTINSQVRLNNSEKIIGEPKFLKENNSAILFLKKQKIPLIAAVRGVCLGSALELIMFCDIKICAENSIFAFPESTFNLMPGFGGTQNILRHTKYSKALEIMLTGSTFSAEEAYKIGIIDKIIPKKEVLESAINIAKTIQNKMEDNYIEK